MEKIVFLFSLCASLVLYSCGNEESETSSEAGIITENYDFTIENENFYLSKANTFLMTSKVSQAISLFAQMAENYPKHKATYLNSLGASYHMHQEYDKAIATYIQSMEAGGNLSTVDDNIWESCEYKYKQDNDSSIMNKYLELFSEGKYVEKAKSILAM